MYVDQFKFIEPREGSANHAVYYRGKGFTRSEYKSKRFADIDFCEQRKIDSTLSFTLNFDCDLSQLTIDKLHHTIETVMTNVDTLLLSKEVKNYIDFKHTPMCINYVLPYKHIFRYEEVSDCLTLTAPVPNMVNTTHHKDKLTLDLVVQYINQSSPYTSVFHEYVHYITKYHPINNNRYSDSFVNEYIASMTSNLVEMTVFSRLAVLDPIVTLNIEPSPWDKEMHALCFGEPQDLPFKSNLSHRRSVFGSFLNSLFVNELKLTTSMLYLHYLNELRELSGGPKEVKDLIARVPSCAKGNSVPAQLFKLQLLDIDLMRLDELDFNSTGGLDNLLAMLTSENLEPKQLFLQCQQTHLSKPLAKYCKQMIIDQLSFKLNTVKTTLPDIEFQSEQLSRRYIRLQQEQTIWLNKKTNKKNELVLKLLEGRYLDSTKGVVDSAALSSIISENDDCISLEKKQVTSLQGFEGTLQLCKVDNNGIHFWSKKQQTQPVLALKDALKNYKSVVFELEPNPESEELEEDELPYIFNQGFVVFQQWDNGMRLNMCLDTGSPKSYITRRYILRKFYTSGDLVDFSILDQSGRVNYRLPIADKYMTVQVMGAEHFGQCDVIVGADLAGIYKQISIDNHFISIRD